MKLLILAVNDRMATLIDRNGHAFRGRYAGRDRTGAALLEGELVSDHTHYRRAISRGDITLVAEQEHSS